MFTTPTGQTGSDAYKYERAQIANTRREIDAREARLEKAIIEEARNETTTDRLCRIACVMSDNAVCRSHDVQLLSESAQCVGFTFYTTVITPDDDVYVYATTYDKHGGHVALCSPPLDHA